MYIFMDFFTFTRAVLYEEGLCPWDRLQMKADIKLLRLKKNPVQKTFFSLRNFDLKISNYFFENQWKSFSNSIDFTKGFPLIFLMEKIQK